MKIKLKSEFFLVTLYVVQSLNMFVKVFIDKNSPFWNFISLIAMIIILVVFLLTIPLVIHKMGIKFIIAQIILLFLFIISLVQNYATTSDLIYTYLWGFISLSCVFYILSLKNLEDFSLIMYRISTIVVPMLSLGLILYSSYNDVSYNMSLSYMLVVPTLILIYHYLKIRKMYILLIILISISIMFLFGARGPFISIILFMLLSMLSSKLTYKKIFSLVLLIVIILIISFNFDILLSLFANALDQINISSRNIRLILSDLQFYNSGRSELFSYYINRINQKPLLGWGILGGWIDISNGPHNMIIELLLSFGLFIGGIISLFLIIIFLHSIYIVLTRKSNYVLLIFAAASFPLYLVSGNIYEKYNLFIFIGVYLWTIKRSGRYEKNM